MALVAANSTPIAGVLLLGWNVFPILLLFWIENVTIGFVNVLKMLTAAPGDAASWLGKLFVIPFFCVHYGIFCLVHGVFIIVLFGGPAVAGKGMLPVARLIPFASTNQLLWPIAGLVASHLFSFAWNYLGHGEYRRASLADLMSQPYSRVVVLHLTVLFGGFVVMALHSPAGGLLLLVVLKTALDVRAHLKERTKFGQPTGEQVPV